MNSPADEAIARALLDTLTTPCVITTKPLDNPHAPERECTAEGTHQVLFRCIVCGHSTPMVTCCEHLNAALFGQAVMQCAPCATAGRGRYLKLVTSFAELPGHP